MELIIAGAIAGLLLAVALFKVIWVLVSSATDNLFDWLVHNFGNERAAREVEEKWKRRR